MKIINNLIQYLKDSIAELKKVSWPTKKETTSYTVLVVGISLAVALFLGLMDYIFTLGVEQVIK